MMQRALVIVALFLLCAISSLAWRTSNYNTMRKMTSKFGLRMAVEEIPSGLFSIALLFSPSIVIY